MALFQGENGKYVSCICFGTLIWAYFGTYQSFIPLNNFNRCVAHFIFSGAVVPFVSEVTTYTTSGAHKNNGDIFHQHKKM
jgi:hypothetical protein